MLRAKTLPKITDRLPIDLELVLAYQSSCTPTVPYVGQNWPDVTVCCEDNLCIHANLLRFSYEVVRRAYNFSKK